jgi:hypothetical protein
MSESYEEELRIDPDNLDHEWEAQPGLYQRYSEMLANAEKEKADLKEELDVLKAKKDLDIREGNYSRSISKLTEGTIESLLKEDEEVQKKVKELNEASYRVKLLGGAVEAFSHRKKALEKMVDLFIFGYNAEPKVGRMDNIREQKRRRRDESNED